VWARTHFDRLELLEQLGVAPTRHRCSEPSKYKDRRRRGASLPEPRRLCARLSRLLPLARSRVPQLVSTWVPERAVGQGKRVRTAERACVHAR
jgi:hypothetical protein